MRKPGQRGEQGVVDLMVVNDWFLVAMAVSTKCFDEVLIIYLFFGNILPKSLKLIAYCTHGCSSSCSMQLR